MELQDGYLQFLEADSYIPLIPNAGVTGNPESTESQWESRDFSIKGGGSITIRFLEGGHGKRVPEQLRSHIGDQMWPVWLEPKRKMPICRI